MRAELLPTGTEGVGLECGEAGENEVTIRNEDWDSANQASISMHGRLHSDPPGWHPQLLTSCQLLLTLPASLCSSSILLSR